MTTWDYIIVGAGSAGCVLANRLSANGRYRVLLLEAGGGDHNPLMRIPLLGSFLGVRNSKYDWNYRTQPDPTRNDRKDFWPRGRRLGGSSVINGMIYVRGDAEDFNHWAQLGNTGWSYDDVEPLFRRIEHHEFDDDGYGQTGEVRITQAKGCHPLSRLFVDANIAMGVPHNPHYNGMQQEGTCILSLTNSGRIRYSSALAYLAPAKSRKNLTIRTNCTVHQIVFEGRRAVGVKFDHLGKQETVNATGEIILSGGSINSPQLLMLSGVGPADHLKKLGINVVHDLPGVGKNLHEHPAIMFQASSKVASYNTQIGPKDVMKHGWNWLFHGKGMLSTVVFQALSFVRTNPSLSLPDIQLHFAPCGFIGTRKRIELLQENSFSIQANVNRPRSRGFLRLKDASYSSAPVIQPNMLSDPYDLATLIEGAKFIKALCKGPVLKPIISHMIIPAETPETEVEWEELVRSHSIPSYHPVGTCKMGTDSHAVVSPRLKVHGLDGLRVVDASIMPQLVSGNTNASAMMIGEKGSDLIQYQTS